MKQYTNENKNDKKLKIWENYIFYFVIQNKKYLLIYESKIK